MFQLTKERAQLLNQFQLTRERERGKKGLLQGLYERQIKLYKLGMNRKTTGRIWGGNAWGGSYEQ